MMWYEFNDKIPERAMRDVFSTFIIPDTVKHIGQKAFCSCNKLEKVFIPKSVDVIEENAFEHCESLEIYCEDEPRVGWVDETRMAIERYDITTPEDDAFNFHRSGGSFTSTTVEREVERQFCWNPCRCPVHTHVDKAETDSWEKVPKKALIFYDREEADSRLFRKVVKDLTREMKGLSKLPLEWEEAGERSWFEEVYPHSAVPTLFYGSEKLYEAIPGVPYAELKATLARIFGSLLSK